MGSAPRTLAPSGCPQPGCHHEPGVHQGSCSVTHRARLNLEVPLDATGQEEELALGAASRLWGGTTHIEVQGGSAHSKTPQILKLSHADRPVSCPSCVSHHPPHPVCTEPGTPRSSGHPQSGAPGEQTPKRSVLPVPARGQQCPGGHPKPMGGIQDLQGGSQAGMKPWPMPHEHPRAPRSSPPHHHGPELHAAGEEAAATELQSFPQVLLAGFGDAWWGRDRAEGRG